MAKTQPCHKLNTCTTEKGNNTKYIRKTTLVQSPFTTISQKMRWAYSNVPKSIRDG